MSIEALLDFDQMPTWRALRQGGYLTDREPALRFFVSHPWQTLDNPDPSGQQWGVLRGTFEKGLGPQPEDMKSGIVSVRGIGGAYALRSSPSQHLFSAFSSLAPPALDRLLSKAAPVALDERQTNSSRNIDYLYRVLDSTLWRQSGILYFQERIRSGRVIRAKERCILDRSIGIWLDYCCVPQDAQDSTEKAYFLDAMLGLTRLASRSHVISLWPDESLQLTRAWCAAEVAINKAATGFMPVKPRDVSLTHLSTFAGDSLFADLSEETAATVADMLNVARNARGPTDVATWLCRNGLRCTVSADLPLVAAGVFAAAASPRRIGPLATAFRFCELVVELIWWIGAFPIIVLAPGMAVFVRIARGAKHWLDKGFLYEYLWMNLFGLLIFLYFLASIAIVFIFFPVELLRRLLESRVAVQRAAFVSRWSRLARNGVQAG